METLKPSEYFQGEDSSADETFDAEERFAETRKRRVGGQQSVLTPEAFDSNDESSESEWVNSSDEEQQITSM